MPNAWSWGRTLIGSWNKTAVQTCNETLRRLNNGYSITNSRREQKIHLQPDAACLIQIPLKEDDFRAGTTPLLIFWEIDRSTERTKQVANKCPGYGALLEEREYRRYWPHAEQAPVKSSGFTKVSSGSSRLLQLWKRSQWRGFSE